MENMKVHHIGYAVKDMQKAIHCFESLGYCMDEPVIDASRNITIVFARNGDACVELVAPCGSPNDVDGILKRTGASPYHICYEVKNVNQSIKELTKSGMGWMLVKQPAKALAIDGAKVAFLYSKNAGLIELVEIQDF